MSLVCTKFAAYMGRILAIDYGKKRTGLAVTDPAKIIPGGLPTVATSELLPFLQDYCAQESVECIVVGWPVQPNGRPSDNQARVAAFIGKLQKAMPDMRIEKYDERFPSVIAHRAMIAAGLGRKRRQDKALVDEISATIILQGFMGI